MGQVLSVGTDLSRHHARSRGVDGTDFAVVYRANVGGITAYFARRGLDAQTVADLTSETFARAIASLGSYDPHLGPPRPWLFGIARLVFAQHCAQLSKNEQTVVALAGRVELSEEDIEEINARIDSQRRAAELLSRLVALPQPEREAIELVDLDGLTPKEAAISLGITAGAFRVRLFRARTRLRKEAR